jgi:hypothetical protein
MKKFLGVWIDHEKAFIVTLAGGKETLKRIDSDVEPHLRLAGGHRSALPSVAQDVVSDKKKEERHKHQLKNYYKEVIKNFRGTEEIFIFGPGEAKTELKKEIKEIKELAGKIKGIEASDKLTERQIIAKVKKFFLGKT